MLGCPGYEMNYFEILTPCDVAKHRIYVTVPYDVMLV